MGLKKANSIGLTFIVLFATTCFAQKNTLKISGYIIDKYTHARLHAAQLFVKEVGQVTLDEEGNFSFEIKKKYIDQNIVLKIKSPGYDDLNYAHQVSPIEIFNQNIEIEMSHNAYSIVGQILDSENKEPLSLGEVRVSVLGEPALQGIIGSDGSYQLIIPIPTALKNNNKITVLVDARGYRPKLFHLNFDNREYQHILGLIWLDKDM